MNTNGFVGTGLWNLQRAGRSNFDFIWLLNEASSHLWLILFAHPCFSFLWNISISVLLFKAALSAFLSPSVFGSLFPSPPSLLIRGRSSEHTVSLLCHPPSLNSTRFLSPVYTSVTMIDRCSFLVNEHFPPHKLLFHVTRLAMPFKRSGNLKSSLQVFLPLAQKKASSSRALFDFAPSLHLNPLIYKSAVSLMYSLLIPGLSVMLLWAVFKNIYRTLQRSWATSHFIFCLHLAWNIWYHCPYSSA